MFGVLDLAAAGAGQVALEQGLELDQERELVAPVNLLLNQVRRHPGRLAVAAGLRRRVGPLRVVSDHGPDAAIPRPPWSAAARSVTMSPNMLFVTMT